MLTPLIDICTGGESHQHRSGEVFGVDKKVGQLPPHPVLATNNAADREGEIQGLSRRTVSHHLAGRLISVENTMANNITLSSHPNARTIWRRTKHRRQTLMAEMARKTVVTVEIALPWLSSMATELRSDRHRGLTCSIENLQEGGTSLLFYSTMHRFPTQARYSDPEEHSIVLGSSDGAEPLRREPTLD